jgi:hypothetical protein
MKRISSNDRINVAILDTEKKEPPTLYKKAVSKRCTNTKPNLFFVMKNGAKKLVLMTVFLREHLLRGRTIPTSIAKFAINDIACTTKDIMVDMVVRTMQLELMSVIIDAAFTAGWTGNSGGLGPIQMMYYIMKAMSIIHS